MIIALHDNTSFDSILKSNGLILINGAQVLDLATIGLTGNHLSNSGKPRGLLEVDVLGGSVVGLPRILHEQCFTSRGIRHNPTRGAAAMKLGAAEERVYR